MGKTLGKLGKVFQTNRPGCSIGAPQIFVLIFSYIIKLCLPYNPNMAMALFVVFAEKGPVYGLTELWLRRYLRGRDKKPRRVFKKKHFPFCWHCKWLDLVKLSGALTMLVFD